MEEKEIYKQGYDAYFKSLLRESNPFVLKDEKKLWFEGWDTAREDDKEKKEDKGSHDSFASG